MVSGLFITNISISWSCRPVDLIEGVLLYINNDCKKKEFKFQKTDQYGESIENRLKEGYEKTKNDRGAFYFGRN